MDFALLLWNIVACRCEEVLYLKDRRNREESGGFGRDCEAEG